MEADPRFCWERTAGAVIILVAELVSFQQGDTPPITLPLRTGTIPGTSTVSDQ